MLLGRCQRNRTFLFQTYSWYLQWDKWTGRRTLVVKVHIRPDGVEGVPYPGTTLSHHPDGKDQKRRENAAESLPMQDDRLHETALSPKGSSIRSWATLLAMCPPFSSEIAPMTAYIVCARIKSSPDPARLSGCADIVSKESTSESRMRTYISGLPSNHLLHIVFMRELGHLPPVGQKALFLRRKILQSIQRGVRKWHTAILVLLGPGTRGLVLHEGKGSLQLHDAFSLSSCQQCTTGKARHHIPKKASRSLNPRRPWSKLLCVTANHFTSSERNLSPPLPSIRM